MKLARKKNLIVFFVFLFFVTTFSIIYQSLFKRPYLTVIGPVEMSDGIGRQSVELIDALKKEHTIGFLQTVKPNFVDVPKDVKKIIKNKYRSLGNVILFFDTVSSPEKKSYEILRTPKNKDQIRLAYSMFESSKIPNEWVEILNEYFDAVLVPDSYHVKVYEESGVMAPIFVVPLGLNLEPLLSLPLKKESSSPMIFGNFGSAIGRKNQLLLVKAFHEAFKEDPTVFLKINARYAHPTTAQEIIDYLSKHEIKNISFMVKSLKGKDYINQLTSLDCLVYLSKGEGFSIQPREAMALGIPVILTDNTAHRTICKSGLVKRISSEMIEPALFTWGTILKEAVVIGDQFNCDQDEVITALKEMKKNYDHYLEKAEMMRAWVKQYDYQEAKWRFEMIIRPKKVVLSTKNKILCDSLHTNSKDLFEKYKKLEKKGFKSL